MTAVIAFILCGSFLLAAYAPALPEAFFIVDDFDLVDIPQLTTASFGDTLRAVFTPGTHLDYYPLRDLSYWLDLHVWHGSYGGEDGTVFRLHNLALFIVAGAGLYHLLRQLRVERFWCAAAAAAWLLHPYHAEMIVWISARKDVLCLALGIWSAVFWVSALRKASWRATAASALLFVLSLLAKASLGLLPWVGLAWMWRQGLWRARRGLAGALAGCGLIGLASSWFQSWHYTHVNDMRFFYEPSYRVAGAFAGFGRSMLGWIAPDWNAVDVFYWGEWSRLNQGFAAAGVCLALALALVAAGAWRARNETLLWSLAVFAVLFLPVSAMAFPHRNFYSVRYLEASCLALWVGAVASASPRWLTPRAPPRLRACAALCLLALAFATLREAPHWHSNRAIIEKSITVTPANPALQTLWVQEMTNLQRWGRLSADEIKAKDDLARKLAEDCLPRLALPLSPNGSLCSTVLRSDYDNDSKSRLTPAERERISDWLMLNFQRQLRRDFSDYALLFEVGKMAKGLPPRPEYLERALRAPFLKATETNRIKLWLALCFSGASEQARDLYREFQSRALVRWPVAAPWVAETLPRMGDRWKLCFPDSGS